MKNLINTVIILITLNFTTMAKGFNVQKEIVIDVSAAELWQMVGPGFVEVYLWSSNVDHAEGSGKSHFNGAVCHNRKCDVNVKGFSSINETLTDYDEKNMVLAYEVNDGMPGFVRKAANEWTVVPISATQSKLVMNAEFITKGLMGSLMNGMMKKKMNQTLETVLNDAKVYAETGKPSKAKQARVAELNKKMKQAA